MIIFLSAALALSSCSKMFDVDSTGNLTGSKAAQMVEKEPEFLFSYVSGLYSWMVTPFTVYSGHDDGGFLLCNMLTDFMGQDIVLDGTEDWGQFDYNFDYGMEQYVRTYQFWTQYYTLINNANTILDYIPAGEEPSSVQVRGYLGQAYAIRALSYMYLMLLYQDPVDESGALRTDAPSVPLVYASRDGIPADVAYERQGRNAYSVVMEHIEYNIAESLKFLDGYVRTSKNEIDQSVAYGIAARYYLFVQKWAEAASAAEKAREGYDIMDRERLLGGFMNLEDNEFMWGFNHTTETQTTYVSFSSHMSNDCEGYAGLDQPGKLIDRSLYDRMSRTDWRRGLFNGPEGDPKASPSTPAAARPYAARKFGYMDQWLQDYIYMRASEMVLIQAEAEARLGDGAKAAATLATLMSRRDPSWSASTVTAADVQIQRRIELWGEGHGYYDIRRNGRGIDRSYEGTNHTPANRIKVPAHDNLWWFQLPLKEITENDKIDESEQNPWSKETTDEDESESKAASVAAQGQWCVRGGREMSFGWLCDVRN